MAMCIHPPVQYNSGYSRGGQRGRGPPRGGYSNREREGGYSNRERDYQRESGGSRGWSGGGGRYGGSNYGAKRGISRGDGSSMFDPPSPCRSVEPSWGQLQQ